MYHQFNIKQFYVLPTQCICVLCGYENKQWLFLYTALTYRFLKPKQCLLRGTSWVFKSDRYSFVLEGLIKLHATKAHDGTEVRLLVFFNLVIK